DRPPTRGADLQWHAPGLEDEEATDEGGMVVGAGGEGDRVVGLGRRLSRAGLLGVQQPGDPVEGSRDRQGCGLAPADLHPDLELVVLPVAVGPGARPAAQAWDQQRPDGEVGPARPVRLLVFTGHPDVAVVAVQPAWVGQAPRCWRRGPDG